MIAWRLPLLFLTIPGRVRRAGRETEDWYQRHLTAVPNLDLPGATAAFNEAAELFIERAALQTTAVIATVQSVYDALQRLVDRAGVGDVGVLSGSGGAEVEGLIGDIWKASRGRIPLEAVIRDHGFHGPLEGSSRARSGARTRSPFAEYSRITQSGTNRRTLR